MENVDNEVKVSMVNDHDEKEKIIKAKLPLKFKVTIGEDKHELVPDLSYGNVTKAISKISKMLTEGIDDNVDQLTLFFEKEHVKIFEKIDYSIVTQMLEKVMEATGLLEMAEANQKLIKEKQ